MKALIEIDVYDQERVQMLLQNAEINYDIRETS